MNVLSVAALVVLISATTFSQTQTCWIVVCDNGSACDTLTFGYAPGATCGVDSHIPCEWIEPPPPPPAGVFDVRFIRCDFSSGRCDIRGYGPPSISDTFRVRYQPSDGGFPVLFQWDTTCIRSLCDSAVLTDPFGGIIFRARMDLVSQYSIASPAFSSSQIIFFGRGLTTHVVEEAVGRLFSLGQNYPNPFNPTTRIEYQLPAKEFVRLRVIDILGREVSTLVNQVQSPGMHSVEFGGEGLASGVYFYRLEAGIFVEHRKMMLLK